MSKHLDLATLTNNQLVSLAWELRGTPAVQPVYAELGSRPWRGHIAANDPDRDAKIDQALREAFGIKEVTV